MSFHIMAPIQRRLRPWQFILIAIIGGCWAWAAYKETNRRHLPPDGWEELLAGKWRAVQPSRLSGRVELIFEPPNSFNLLGGDRILPALWEIVPVKPYEHEDLKRLGASEQGCYLTDNVNEYLFPEGEVWGPPPEYEERIRQGVVKLTGAGREWRLLACSVRGELQLRLVFPLDRDIDTYLHVVFQKAP